MPDWAYDVAPTSDGGYAVIGDTDWSDSDRNSDIWIVKVNAPGELGCGMNSNSTAVADSHTVTTNSSNSYSVSDTSVVLGNPAGSFATITP